MPQTTITVSNDEVRTAVREWLKLKHQIDVTASNMKPQYLNYNGRIDHEIDEDTKITFVIANADTLLQQKFQAAADEKADKRVEAALETARSALGSKKKKPGSAADDNF